MKIEEFIFRGLKCAIHKHDEMGHLCGYLHLTENHPWYERHYTDMDDDGIRVHGGLTYAAKEGDDWVLGFDCGHAFDLVPGLSRWSNNHLPGSVYRDENYVRSECYKLALQALRVMPVTDDFHLLFYVRSFTEELLSEEPDEDKLKDAAVFLIGHPDIPFYFLWGTIWVPNEKGVVEISTTHLWLDPKQNVESGRPLFSNKMTEDGKFICIRPLQYPTKVVNLVSAINDWDRPRYEETLRAFLQHTENRR